MDVRATLLLALAAPASAQQVIKCIDGGKTVYQREPASGLHHNHQQEYEPATGLKYCALAIASLGDT